MNREWKNKEEVIMQAGGLLLARRSQRLRRTPALQISTVLAQTTLSRGYANFKWNKKT